MKGKIKIIMIILASTLLLTITAGYLWRGGVMAPSVPADKLTISTSLSTVTGMLLIAQEKGYFLKNALEVTLRFLPSGNVGLEQLKTGETDFACSTEFALVSGIFGEGQSLRCLGAVAAAEDAQVIARKGGISQPGDLKGKKVGLFRGSSAEFFLGRFLTLHGLSTGDVEPVNLDPFAMAAALREGRVDAVMIWEPTALPLPVNWEIGLAAGRARGGRNTISCW